MKGRLVLPQKGGSVLRARVCFSRQETGCRAGIPAAERFIRETRSPHNFTTRSMPEQSTRKDILQSLVPQDPRAHVLLARAEALARALAEARTGALAHAEAEAEARRVLQARSRAEAGVLARARAQMRAQVRVLAQAQTRTLALAGALAQSQATRTAESRTRAWPPNMTRYRIRYSEVLADSKLKYIIDHILILPHYRDWLAHDLWRSPEYWWLIQILIPITRLPPKLFQQILLINIDEQQVPLVLMLVCKYWCTAVTDILVLLKLGTKTPKYAVTGKLERGQRRLYISVDTESDRGDFTPSEGDYEAIIAAIEASSLWRSFVVETFPASADLPERLVNRRLQPSSGVVMSRLREFRIKCACEMSPLLDHLLRVLGTTVSGELTTVEINSTCVISFLASTYSSIFNSIKVLSLDTPGLPNPVDLLPHLHQLESLTASHLSLPTYRSDVNLPFVHTLRHLRLRAVSIQWMSGRTFRALESCILLFPLHRHILHTFSITLPNCRHLIFQGNPLDILDGVSAHKLIHLSVISSCSKPRGTRQLARFSSQVLRENQLAPRILHISIEATTQAWTKALPFMSNLEELVIDNAHPSSLGVEVLQSLIVHPVHANYLGNTATLGGRNSPVYPSLKRFGLRYRRWLQPNEHFDWIPELMSIIWSRQESKLSLQRFRIWTGSGQNPLELIQGSRISLEGFERLANDSAIKGGDLLESVVSRLVDSVFRPSGESSSACPQL
jgi:hypothetical protein